MNRHDILSLIAANEPVQAYEAALGSLWADGLRRFIPEHMHFTVVMWVVFAEDGDTFLDAVVEGDLFKACACADDTNRNMLFNYAMFFHNYTPSGCFKRGALESWKGIFDA